MAKRTKKPGRPHGSKNRVKRKDAKRGPMPPVRYKTEDAQIVTLTPNMCRELLETMLHRKNFRSQNRSRAEAIAQDIKANAFTFNGNSIVVNERGILVDGQKRCFASVLADKPIRVVLVSGVKDDANIDTGQGRTIAQVLKYSGEVDVNRLASVLRMIWRWEHDVLWHPFKGVAGTHNQLLHVLKRHPDVPADLRISQPTTYILTNTVSGFIIHQGAHLSRCTNGLKEDFIDGIAKGVKLSDDDPRFVIRKIMLADRQAENRMSRLQVMATAINAWNYFRREEGVSAKEIRWKATGPRKQPFPRLIGDKRGD
jgi:hypothetical protein